MKFSRYIIGFLVLLIVLEVLAFSKSDNKMHLISCNVGQGDATLVVYKNIDILLDGGPDSKVLNCLEKFLPFWDRRIELVVLSHPEKDHFGGLIEVFKKYKVDNFLFNPIESSTPDYKLLEKEAGSDRPKYLYPVYPMSIRLGLIYLDILHPNQSALDALQIKEGNNIFEKYSTNGNLNNFSIVARLRLNKFTALLTGDATTSVLDNIAESPEAYPVYYIKVSHHGSKTGTTDNFLKSFVPKVAVISVGKNNYGQPDINVLNLIGNIGAKIFRTDKNGNVDVSTDGEVVKISSK